MAYDERVLKSLLSGILSGAFDSDASGADYDMTDAGDLGIARNTNPFWYTDPDDPTLKIVFAPYNPSDDIVEFIDRLEIFEDEVDALDESTDWNAFIDTATTTADVLYSDDEIQDVVTAFSNRQQLQLNRAQNQFSGGMVDLNAVQGSAFINGLALQALAHKQDGANFEADITFNYKKERIGFIANSAEVMRAMRDKRVDMLQNVTHLRTELERIKIVAMSEFMEENMTRSRKAVMWNLELHQYAANLLGADGGAALPPGRGDEINTTKSTIGGALVGAQAGSQYGVGGMAIGALVGGALGNVAAE